MRLRLAAIFAIGLFTLGIAACGSSSTNDSNSTTTTTPTPTTVAPSSSTAKSSNHCSTDQLKASLGDTQSGAGQRYTVFLLTNTGTKACELRGFPGVSLLDASGKEIGQPAAREGAEGPGLSIAPGASVSATLHTSAPGMGAACEPTSTQMRVYPPDNTTALTFAATYSACGGFRVSTLVAGNAGN